MPKQLNDSHQAVLVDDKDASESFTEYFYQTAK